MTKTAQQNRYQRALEASIGELNREQSTGGHSTFFEYNHRVLTEHAPTAGPDPKCQGPECDEPWPCENANSAMGQVGVRS
ncbi:hypothetical protein ACWCQM_10930 [Streptomyces sp. NPDC002125]